MSASSIDSGRKLYDGKPKLCDSQHIPVETKRNVFTDIKSFNWYKHLYAHNLTSDKSEEPKTVMSKYHMLGGIVLSDKNYSYAGLEKIWIIMFVTSINL
jgi:hypothetical protein